MEFESYGSTNEHTYKAFIESKNSFRVVGSSSFERHTCGESIDAFFPLKMVINTSGITAVEGHV